MRSYLKKSNWGDYWAFDSSLDDHKLIELSFDHLAHLSVRVNHLENVAADEESPQAILDQSASS